MEQHDFAILRLKNVELCTVANWAAQRRLNSGVRVFLEPRHQPATRKDVVGLLMCLLSVYQNNTHAYTQQSHHGG